jgi:hypothetical protein
MPVQHLETDIARGHGQTLGAFAGEIQHSTQALGQSAAALAGAWRGPSSDQFAELIEPELHRLAQLADDGLALRGRLLREIEEWERVDSRFGDATASGAGGVTAPGSGASADAGESTTAPPAEAPRPDFKLNDLLDYDPHYPDGLGETMESMHEHFMNCVRGDCPDSSIYREMAEMTGLSEEEVREQFAKAVTTAREAGLDDNNPAFNSLAFYHDSHWGSRRQLMFGKVVGDHLGIHPVFAAFLSPSGGLIGPGDDVAIRILENDLSGAFNENAWDYHGAAHDAFGYLYNHHDIGPGYQYCDSPLNQLDALGTDSFLSGQLSGYVYWARQMGVPEYALDLVIRHNDPLSLF